MSGTPSTIHRYEIEARIGEGGMGALYLARDPALDRQVAIKVLREGFDNPDLRERFIREAKSAARLTHVNIVRIFDFGEHEGQPYIAMEYIPGETIADKIKRRAQIPLGERLRYMEDLCDGLAHAHKAQIVHRDIKPANVMISPDGHLKILDFGIARLGDSKMTQAGMLVGTLNYMSPEQLAGGQVDQRSDIFAVGAVFYELLAYRQAFPGGLHDGLLHRILHAPPEPIEKFCPDLDPEIIRIIARAIEKDPARRYASLNEMEREIAHVRDWLPSEATQVIATPDAATMAIAVPRPSDPSGSRPRSSASQPPPVVTPPPPVPPAPPTIATPPPSAIKAAPADVTVPIPAVKPPASGAGTKPPGTDPALAQQKRASEVQSLIDRAQQAFEQGKYAEAIGAAEAVLVRTPDHAAALALVARARRERQAAAARGAAQAALAALAEGHIEVAERHIADGAAADTDHPEVLAAHVKVKEARAAAEAERMKRTAEAAERERARAREADARRQADEARRREEEARRREQDEVRRREEAELVRRRAAETEQQRQAEAAARAGQLQQQLALAEAALTEGRPDEAMQALDRAVAIDAGARVGALRVRAEALRDELARAEAGRRQREKDQRMAAAQARIKTILGSWPVRIAAGLLVVVLAASWILPRLRREDPPVNPGPAPAPVNRDVRPPAPPAPAPAPVPDPPSPLARARTLYGEGKRVDALQALQTDDPELANKAGRGLAELWLTEARLAVASSAERVLRAGIRSSSAGYRQAAARRSQADRHREGGRLADALLAYWQAIEMYDALQPGAPPAAAATTPTTPAGEQPKVELPPATTTTTSTPVGPPVFTPSPSKPAEPAPASPAPEAERASVLQTVYQFAAAMNSRDAAAVMRLRRMSAQERKQLEDIAKGLVSYSYQLTPTGAPTIDGTRATLRCLRQQTFVDGSRRKRDQNDTVQLELVREGSGWIITAVSPAR